MKDSIESYWSYDPKSKSVISAGANQIAYLKRRAMPYAECFRPFRATIRPERALDNSIGHHPMNTTIWCVPSGSIIDLHDCLSHYMAAISEQESDHICYTSGRHPLMKVRIRH